jgi:hypothetical protein
MDAELRALFPETVTVHAWTGDSAYGAPAFASTGTAYPARLERATRRVVNGEGRQVVATTTVYLAPTSTGGLPSLSVRDRLVWGASTAEALPVLAWERYADESGAWHHVEAYCG